MRVAIVAGPPCAGKSTFIKKEFPNAHVIDVFDFQTSMMTPADVMESYLKCRDALIEALRTYDDVVLEHTLLKAKRRPMYIEAIRSVTDAPIDMYYLKPSTEEYCRRLMRRKCFRNDKDAEYMLNFGDIPIIEEGYNSVHIIDA